MRFSIFYIVLVSLIFTCCKNNAEKKANKQEVNPAKMDKQVFSSNANSTHKALDMLLISCGDYSYFENYFRIPYHGCLYNPANNPNNVLGMADIVLIPERNMLNYSLYDDEYYRQQDSIVQSVNNMSVNEIKEEFYVIVFLVRKNDLEYKNNSEIEYYPNLPYKVEMYEHKSDQNEWNLKDSTIIHIYSDETKWVESQLENILAD